MATCRLVRGNVFLFCSFLLLACLLWPIVVHINNKRLSPVTKFSTKDSLSGQKSKLVNYRPVNFSEYIDSLRHDITQHQALDPYFIPRNHKVNSYDYSFLIDGRNICQRESPFLLVVVPSVFDHQENRMVIRETWGSVVRTGMWADGTPLPLIKLIFLFGQRHDPSLFSTLKEENLQYGDIVLANFVDSYRNLTIKSMAALYWTIRFCPDAKYLLKNDEDTIVNLPRLVELLKDKVPNSIIGHKGHVLSVTRDGYIEKWIVSKEEYPPDKYPPYILGNFYAIPKDLIPKLFHVSQYIPYLSMEDVFITGVVRVTIDAGLQGVDSCLGQCDFNITKFRGYKHQANRLRKMPLEEWDCERQEKVTQFSIFSSKTSQGETKEKMCK
ncbi:beta-1,3-galactosyltransferase 5-like [Liolophura sinensis]|uniref:beta-1,3-galactosyltransferase 5-like n=1 Tax=Liolophura sinensis TaxID=3198878 RepID=UPI003157F461